MLRGDTRGAMKQGVNEINSHFLPRVHRRSPYHPSQGKHAKANPQNLLQSQVFIVKSHSYVLSRPQRFSFLILLSTATTHTMMATLLIMVNERLDLKIHSVYQSNPFNRSNLWYFVRSKTQHMTTTTTTMVRHSKIASFGKQKWIISKENQKTTNNQLVTWLKAYKWQRTKTKRKSHFSILRLTRPSIGKFVLVKVFLMCQLLSQASCTQWMKLTFLDSTNQ